MIGVVHRQISANSTEIMSLGPLWPGVVVRGVWLSINPIVYAGVNVALALCGGAAVVLADVQAGQSLVLTTDLPIAAYFGIPSFQVSLSSNVGREFIVPVYAPIEEGSAWLCAAVNGVGGAINVTMGIVFEPERVVTPSMDRGPVGRKLRGGGVLSELRTAAEAARV